MTVYHFDHFDGRGRHVDMFGIELPTEAEAVEQADALVHALMGEALDRGSPEAVWVDVRSGDGRAVYSAKLSLSRNWAGGARPVSAGPGERSA